MFFIALYIALICAIFGIVSSVIGILLSILIKKKYWILVFSASALGCLICGGILGLFLTII